MPTWEWILIAVSIVIVVAVLAIAAKVVSSRRKTNRLKQHYGREYERLVSQAGNPKVAEQELTAREREREQARHCSVDAVGTIGLQRPLAAGADRIRR